METKRVIWEARKSRRVGDLLVLMLMTREKLNEHHVECWKCLMMEISHLISIRSVQLIRL